MRPSACPLRPPGPGFYQTVTGRWTVFDWTCWTALLPVRYQPAIGYAGQFHQFITGCLSVRVLFFVSLSSVGYWLVRLVCDQPVLCVSLDSPSDRHLIITYHDDSSLVTNRVDRLSIRHLSERCLVFHTVCNAVSRAVIRLMTDCVLKCSFLTDHPESTIRIKCCHKVYQSWWTVWATVRRLSLSSWYVFLFVNQSLSVDFACLFFHQKSPRSITGDAS